MTVNLKKGGNKTNRAVGGNNTHKETEHMHKLVSQSGTRIKGLGDIGQNEMRDYKRFSMCKRKAVHPQNLSAIREISQKQVFVRTGGVGTKNHKKSR